MRVVVGTGRNLIKLRYVFFDDLIGVGTGIVFNFNLFRHRVPTPSPSLVDYFKPADTGEFTNAKQRLL
jgi:hypothetical protein